MNNFPYGIFSPHPNRVIYYKKDVYKQEVILDQTHSKHNPVNKHGAESRQMDQCTYLSTHTDSNEQITLLKPNIHERVRKIHAQVKPYGVHSTTIMSTAGFRYTGHNDTVRCDTCHLEVSEWTKEMIPFIVHMQRSPHCTFVRSRLSQPLLDLSDQENPAKRQKTDSNSSQWKYNYRLVEVKTLKQIRRRTFSHWSRRMKPSIEQMIAAGFFATNVGDRVICLYCNLICQQWTADTDDPSEVHQTLSPLCPYVLSMLTYPQLSPTLILNDTSSTNLNYQTPRYDPIVYTTPCHTTYSDMTKRLESFRTWSHETSSPSVDELVRAGFFYTGASNIVTCFYCNGSLQNWSATDNPTNEHARWFEHCPYAKQLCGDDLHRKIQEAKHARQERHRTTNQSNETSDYSHSSNSNQSQLQISDSSMLSRLVAARLDLSNSQSLLDQNFKLSVIKRSWEDQLQLKKDDFASDSDLLISCIILQKQIDHIQGNKENIIIPRDRMKLVRERQQSGLSPLPTSSDDSNKEILEKQPVSTTSTIESTTTTITKEQLNVTETSSTKSSSVSNPCIICYQDEKRLACIPCGHFTTCVPCSHSLRTCPVCRREIEAFVRIYI